MQDRDEENRVSALAAKEQLEAIAGIRRGHEQAMRGEGIPARDFFAFLQGNSSVFKRRRGLESEPQAGA